MLGSSSSPYQKTRISRAKNAIQVRGGKAGEVMVDISKTPQMSAFGILVPTLLTSSLVWSERKQRWMLPTEQLMCQGIQTCENPGGSQQVAHEFDDLTDGSVRELAGNAMCMPAVGTIVF